MTATAYNNLCDELRALSVLASTASVLGWDEQVNMPSAGAEHRAGQLAALAGITHARATSPALGDLISAAEDADSGDDSAENAVIREARRSYDRQTKLPQKLVEEMSRVTTLSQHAWVTARRSSDFQVFRPWLEQVVSLKREQADILRKDGQSRYDVLLDEYEPGMTTTDVVSVFADLAQELSALVKTVGDCGTQVDTTPLKGPYPIPAQRELTRFASESIGFDFQAGRIDEAAHPFCSGFGPGDCRLTTRYDEHFLSQGLYGTLHETGHGLYEQGLPKEAYGTCLGESASLGVHESQSRLWENAIGRSREFWDFLRPTVTRLFPDASEWSPEAFFLAAGEVAPSLIRVEADEVTYNLHILLRFEMEQAIIDEGMNIADVPTRWNERFQELFGIEVPDDAHGCMQDVHWSAGLIGYFPTYTLGNLYAAQLYDAADAAIGPIPQLVTKGEFIPLLDWLRTHIHVHGMRYRANQLMENATGQKLCHEPLINSLKAKCAAVYGL